MATLSQNDIAKAIYVSLKDKAESESVEMNKKVVSFLSKKRLLSKSDSILEKLDALINQDNGILVAKVKSSKELTDKTKNNITSVLKDRYRAQEVRLRVEIDESLVGGVRIEALDEVIDLSVKNKLKKLKDHLIKKI